MLNLFLQAFDEGWMTDGRGKRVYLSDAIVIMTSNIGSEHFRKLTSPLGFLSRTGRRRAGAGRGQSASWNGASRRSSATASTRSCCSGR